MSKLECPRGLGGLKISVYIGALSGFVTLRKFIGTSRGKITVALRISLQYLASDLFIQQH